MTTDNNTSCALVAGIWMGHMHKGPYGNEQEVSDLTKCPALSHVRLEFRETYFNI